MLTHKAASCLGGRYWSRRCHAAVSAQDDSFSPSMAVSSRSAYDASSAASQPQSHPLCAVSTTRVSSLETRILLPARLGCVACSRCARLSASRSSRPHTFAQIGRSGGPPPTLQFRGIPHQEVKRGSQAQGVMVKRDWRTKCDLFGHLQALLDFCIDTPAPRIGRNAA
jgi:hypothetical protein